jgi:hypothetical protein
LSIHSAEVAFIDLADAPVLSEPLRHEYDPSGQEVWRFRVVENAVLCRTGGDGLFPFEVRGDAAGCTEIEVLCDDPGVVPDVWEPAATIHVRSGVLLVADPYWLREYTVEDYDGPVFLGGLWIEMQLPGVGDVAVDLGIGESATPWDSPLVVRARWLGA